MKKAKVQELPSNAATIAEDLDEALNKLRDVNEAMFDLSWMMTEWHPDSIPTQRSMHPTGIVNLLSDCYEEVGKDLRNIWRRLPRGGGA